MMTRKPAARTLMVVLAAAVAVAVPAWQAMSDFGMSAGEFSAQGDATLRAAGYAFSIWGLIYAGLLAYAVYQATPLARETPLLQRLGWPSVAAMTGCGAWIAASALNLQWLTVAIIVISAASLIAGLMGARDQSAAPRDRWLVVAPLSLLAGWLTAASALNLLMVLTAQGLIYPGPAWGVGGLVAVLAVGGMVGWRLRSWIYLAPVVWGLVAAFMAHRGDSTIVANTAAVAAAVLLAEAVVIALRQR